MADSDYVQPASVSFLFNEVSPPPLPRPEDSHRHLVFFDFLERVIIERVFLFVLKIL